MKKLYLLAVALVAFMSVGGVVSAAEKKYEAPPFVGAPAPIPAGLITAPRQVSAKAVRPRGALRIPIRIRLALWYSLLLAFVVSFDDFLIAFFLCGTDTTLPVYIWGELRFPYKLPNLLALGASILVVSTVVITTAEWLPPSKKELDGKGITPDIAMIPDENGRDVELGEAIRYLRDHKA